MVARGDSPGDHPRFSERFQDSALSHDPIIKFIDEYVRLVSTFAIEDRDKAHAWVLSVASQHIVDIAAEAIGAVEDSFRGRNTLSVQKGIGRCQKRRRTLTRLIKAGAKKAVPDLMFINEIRSVLHALINDVSILIVEAEEAERAVEKAKIP
jgi:hypothetical protein